MGIRIATQRKDSPKKKTMARKRDVPRKHVNDEDEFDWIVGMGRPNSEEITANRAKFFENGKYDYDSLRDDEGMERPVSEEITTNQAKVFENGKYDYDSLRNDEGVDFEEGGEWPVHMGQPSGMSTWTETNRAILSESYYKSGYDSLSDEGERDDDTGDDADDEDEGLAEDGEWPVGMGHPSGVRWKHIDDEDEGLEWTVEEGERPVGTGQPSGTGWTEANPCVIWSKAHQHESGYDSLSDEGERDGDTGCDADDEDEGLEWTVEDGEWPVGMGQPSGIRRWAETNHALLTESYHKSGYDSLSDEGGRDDDTGDDADDEDEGLVEDGEWPVGVGQPSGVMWKHVDDEDEGLEWTVEDDAWPVGMGQPSGIGWTEANPCVIWSKAHHESGYDRLSDEGERDDDTVDDADDEDEGLEWTVDAVARWHGTTRWS